jgi:RNA polymerase-binding transcription factor DksA
LKIKFCSACQQEISASRLEAKPGAVLCTHCQESLEQSMEPVVVQRSAYSSEQHEMVGTLFGTGTMG